MIALRDKQGVPPGTHRTSAGAIIAVHQITGALADERVVAISDRPCVDCPTTKAVVTADARRRLRHAKTAAPPSWPYRIEDSSVLI